MGKPMRCGRPSKRHCKKRLRTKITILNNRDKHLLKSPDNEQSEMAQNLTTTIIKNYYSSVLAKSSAGLRILITPSAMALSRSVFFTPKFYGGSYRSTFGYAVPRSGNANPVRPATLILIRIMVAVLNSSRALP